MNKEDIIDGAMYRLLETPEHELETWCKHNLLVAKFFDNTIMFRDTYWNSGVYTTSFEEVGDRIEFVLDLNHSKLVSRREWREYDCCNRAWIPIGGDGEQWIIDDRVDKSYDMVKLALESDIGSLESTIRIAQIDRDLKKKELDRLMRR